MEDDPLRSALLLQHAHDVVVGVAVVDDQGRAGALRDRDVRAERLLLQPVPVGLGGAEAVQPGLPHRDDVRQGGERLDLAQHVVGGGAARGLVGMDRDGGVHAVVLRRDLRRPPAAREVDTDLHHDVDADGAGRRERLLDGDVHEVEVAVAVQHGDRERLGQRRRVAGPPVRPVHSAAASSRASSSSTTVGSSLRNSGVGAAIGCPTRIGRDSQTAAVS